MSVGSTVIAISTNGRGLHLITREIEAALSFMKTEGNGLLNVFLQHTSASLLIQENADPSARADLEEFLNRLVPEGEGWHRHLDEGPDDTVSHMKASITATSLSIPIIEGRLALGTWQGVYVWEHRRVGHRRKIIATAITDARQK